MMEKSGATANNKNHAFSLFLNLPGCNPNPLFVTKPKDNRFEIKNKHAEIKVVERILLTFTASANPRPSGPSLLQSSANQAISKCQTLGVQVSDLWNL